VLVGNTVEVRVLATAPAAAACRACQKSQTLSSAGELPTLVPDGEMAVQDEHGITDFHALRFARLLEG
jgi:hypothetical protein